MKTAKRGICVVLLIMILSMGIFLQTGSEGTVHAAQSTTTGWKTVNGKTFYYK